MTTIFFEINNKNLDRVILLGWGGFQDVPKVVGKSSKAISNKEKKLCNFSPEFEYIFIPVFKFYMGVLKLQVKILYNTRTNTKISEKI